MLLVLSFLSLCVAEDTRFNNVLEEWFHLHHSFAWPAETPGRQLSEGASIHFSSPATDHGAIINISVSAPQEVGAAACNSTYIALYTPFDADLNKTAPIRYQSVRFLSKFCKTGQGVFSFRLNNLHTGGYSAYLLQGGLNLIPKQGKQDTFAYGGVKPYVGLGGMSPRTGLTSKILARSTPLSFRKPNEPTHIRATPGLTPGTFVFSWNQRTSSRGGVLRWSFEPVQNHKTGGISVSASGRTLTRNDLCSFGPAADMGFRDMGKQWSATVDLSAVSRRQIFFAVGDDLDGSDTLPFDVPLLPGATSVPQDWVSYGDQGVGHDDDSYSGRNYDNGEDALRVAQSVTRLSQARKLQGVLVNGDLTYADGYLAQIEDYLDMVQPFASRVPFLISAGNHEADWYRSNASIDYDSPDQSTTTADFWNTDSFPGASVASGGECDVAFKIWPQVNASSGKPWYSYASGLLTVVVYSTEHDFRFGSEQWDWLNFTLATVNRSLTPFVLVAGHRPMYSSHPDPSTTWGSDQTGNDLLQAFIEPLLEVYRVTLTMQGHIHLTQRCCASSNNSCAQNSTLSEDGFNEYLHPTHPVHYVVGNAGARTNNKPPLAPFTLFSSTSIAYAVITIQSPTVLEVQLINPKKDTALDKSRIIIFPCPQAQLRSVFSSCSLRDMNSACSATCAYQAHLLETVFLRLNASQVHVWDCVDTFDMSFGSKYEDGLLGRAFLRRLARSRPLCPLGQIPSEPLLPPPAEDQQQQRAKRRKKS